MVQCALEYTILRLCSLCQLEIAKKNWLNSSYTQKRRVVGRCSVWSSDRSWDFNEIIELFLTPFSPLVDFFNIWTIADEHEKLKAFSSMKE